MDCQRTFDWEKKMALTFATVAEGATDHAVIQNLLLGFCKDQDLQSGDISPVQPLIDETGKQLGSSVGGWQQVFRWLKEKRYRSAFQFNEHVVVQLDTDVCEQAGFDVAKTANGKAIPPKELVLAVRERLAAVIGEDDLREYSGRFHFAIAVESIECWLLPLWGKADEFANIHNCKQRVDDGLARAKSAGLRKDDVRTYLAASAELRKRKRLLETAKSQKSLELFCDSLGQILPKESK